LKDISDEVGISRERVRQIVDEALTKLNEKMNDEVPTRFLRDEEEAGDEAYAEEE
jgi:DNA-directed RNA polymerase sigma subunit (sigma70/sigma32)